MTPGAGPPMLAPRDALVVFSGRVALRWLRVLKAGFRHCFVLIEADGGWVLYNPMSSGTELDFLAGLDLDGLDRFFRGRGYTTVRTRRQPFAPRPVPWRPYTCVEAVKRALGTRAPCVWTPWQLYRMLKKSIK